MRICTKCATSKPLDDFYDHPVGKDGKQSQCKECTKAAVRANRSAKIDYYRQYDKMRFQRDPHRREANKAYDRTERGKAVKRATVMRYIQNNPEKRAAHIILGNAVRSGRVAKPTTCSRCGISPRRRDLHGHHHDYAKPLDVEWICVWCHGEEHWGEQDASATHR